MFQSGDISSSSTNQKLTNAGKNMEKMLPQFTVDGIVNQYNDYRRLSD